MRYALPSILLSLLLFSGCISTSNVSRGSLDNAIHASKQSDPRKRRISPGVQPPTPAPEEKRESISLRNRFRRTEATTTTSTTTTSSSGSHSSEESNIVIKMGYEEAVLLSRTGRFNHLGFFKVGFPVDSDRTFFLGTAVGAIDMDEQNYYYGDYTDNYFLHIRFDGEYQYITKPYSTLSPALGIIGGTSFAMWEYENSFTAPVLDTNGVQIGTDQISSDWIQQFHGGASAGFVLNHDGPVGIELMADLTARFYRGKTGEGFDDDLHYYPELGLGLRLGVLFKRSR